MSAALTMLDRALILAQSELEALNSGNVEAAESHCMQRAEILTSAYKKHDEKNHEDYLFKLTALQGYNQNICEAGKELKESIRAELHTAKKKTNAAKSYMKLSHRY